MYVVVRTKYVLLLGTWIILAGRVCLLSLTLGLLGILIAMRIFGHVERGHTSFPREEAKRRGAMSVRLLLAAFYLLPVFLFQVLRGAVRLAVLTVHPKLRFQPGIIRVPTTLKNPSAITALANLITLSPGTLTLDYDPQEGCYYIHCIDICGLDGEASRRALIAHLEPPLRRIFE